MATAIAQIMKYHEYPQWYEWSAMPDAVINPNSYGADVVSGLMHNIGDRVDMNYGCDASGADDEDMDNVFQSYGYANAHQIGYDGTNNYEDVEDELDVGRNWGWDGRYNGFYGLGSFEPDDRDYDYRSEVVVGIEF